MGLNRRHCIRTVGATITGITAGCTTQTSTTQRSLVVSSPVLEDGGVLPPRFTCDGEGLSPPFEISKRPEPTAAFAITGDYNRGPINEPVFWSIWNIPPETTRIPAGLPRTPTVASLNEARQGKRRGGDVGYKPPCPPLGQAYEHRFQVYALSETLDVAAGTKHDDAVEAIGSAVVASSRLTVTLQRSTERTPDKA